MQERWGDGVSGGVRSWRLSSCPALCRVCTSLNVAQGYVPSTQPGVIQVLESGRLCGGSRRRINIRTGGLGATCLKVRCPYRKFSCPSVCRNVLFWAKHSFLGHVTTHHSRFSITSTSSPHSFPPRPGFPLSCRRQF